MNKACVSEIFKSIQGEGPYRGDAHIFVRFYGCNLGCSFCDTKLIRYQEYDVDELTHKVCQYRGCRTVALTGGEPLLQADFIAAFAQRLKSACLRVYLETNGILHEALAKVIKYVDTVAMDFKLPSSTGLRHYWLEHEKFLTIARSKEVFVKTVIGPQTHMADIWSTIEIITKVDTRTLVVLQPQNPLEASLDDKISHFERMLTDHGLTAEIIPQLHKQLRVR